MPVVDKNTIKEHCGGLRGEIKSIGERVKALKQHKVFKGEQVYAEQHSEMLANIMLAYRHLEDARMRVGKILQAHDGGTSIYDKEA